MPGKNSDMRILNGRTKGDSFGRATFHGNNGISVVDYIICDQEIFENANYFVVKSPTYLSDHSQIITWIDISQTIEEHDTGPCNIEMSKLPNQFIWNNDAKNNFRETLRSPEIQRKMNEFVDSNFTNDLNGINKCLCEFQKILLETSKKCLKIKKSKLRRKITNVVQKKWFDKECRIKRHHLRKLSNLKHNDPTNTELRKTYHDALKSYKETLQMKQKEFHNNKIDELEKASQSNFNLFWKILKNSSDDFDTDTNSKNNAPKETEWFSHFGKLHCEHQLSKEQEEIVEKFKQIENSKNLLNGLDTEITVEEIINAAKKIKSKKAAYSDRINNEMIKYSVDVLANGFTKLFNTILKSGNFPSPWCEGLISPIFKSGNKLEPNNYRGICVKFIGEILLLSPQ